MKEDILEALAKLDVLDKDNFTDNGDVKVSVVSELVGKTVTRQDIVDAAPSFSITNTELPEAEQVPNDEFNTGNGDDTAVEDDTDYSLITEYLEGDHLSLQEFVTFLNEVPIESLKAFKEVVAQQVIEARETAKKAIQLEREFTQGLGFVEMRLKQAFPEKTTGEAIRDYLESQKQLSQQKTTKAAEIRKGFDIKDVDPRAMIDRAMARNTTRGTKRPTKT